MLTLLNCLISILRTFILPPRLSLGAVEQNGKSQLHKGKEEKREREREREKELVEKTVHVMRGNCFWCRYALLCDII